ncbi:MAG: aldolase/citrate lyase family protein [Pirellulales bacterium]
MAESFKTRLARGDLLRVFALGRVVHPVVVDLFGMVGGFDGFWLDHEHGGVSTQDIVLASTCARANGFDCFVRVPPIGYWQVTQALEAGAGGVMGAQIHSAEHARQFLSWTKFSPAGTRGLNSGGFDAQYTIKPLAQFAADANRDGLVAIQIETLGALQDAYEIASLDGVDVLFVGPADLSLALGIVAQFDSPKLWEAIAQVQQACERHGKTWGTVVPNPQYAAKSVEYGCRMLTMGSDVLCLRRGIEAVRETFAAYF